MKLLKTTFTNESFFSRYAHLSYVLGIVAIIGQLISGTTESIIIYTSSLINFQKMLSPEYAQAFALVVTFLGVVIIELGLLVLLPLTIQAFLYKRFKGLDLLISCFIIPACAGLLCVGTLMSFKGSKVLVQKGFGEVELESKKPIHYVYEQELEKVNTKHNQVNKHIAIRKDKELEQLQALHKAQVSKLSQEISQIEQTEKRTGKSFITRKNTLNKRLSEKELNHQGKVLALIQRYDNELNNNENKRESKLSKLSTSNDQNISQLNAANKKKELAHEGNINNYGSLLGYLTMIMVFILLVSHIIKQAHLKGSGIEDKVIVSDSYFQENILTSFFKAIGVLLDTKLRELVSWIESKTPDTPQPVAPQSLINRKELNQSNISLSPRQRIGFNKSSGAFNSHESTHKKTSESTNVKSEIITYEQLAPALNQGEKDYTYVNTLRALNKSKKALASHKQKATYQKKTKGFILDRTSKAITHQEHRVKELTSKINSLKEMR
jgi:hypothetical protein